MIDQLRQMAIFAKTIDHGSFRGAAGELRLSPSVVSHHISQLEEHLGVALIYRSTRRLTLTQDGARLLAASRQMLEAVEGELAEMTATARAPSGELRVTVAAMLSQSHLVERIVGFAKAHPRVSLSLDFSDTRRALIEGGYDIAIRMGARPKTAARMRSLFKVPRIAVAATSYLKGRAPVVSPAETLDWDWIELTLVQDGRATFRKPGQADVTQKPATRIGTNNAQSLYELVRAGAGIAIVPEFLAARDLASGRVSHVLPDWTLAPIDVFAMWPANAPRHGLTHLMLDALGEAQT